MKFVKLKGDKADFYVNPEHVSTILVPDQDGRPLIGHALITVLGVGTLVVEHSPDDVAEMLSMSVVKFLLPHN